MGLRETELMEVAMRCDGGGDIDVETALPEDVKKEYIALPATYKFNVIEVVAATKKHHGGKGGSDGRVRGMIDCGEAGRQWNGCRYESF